MPHGRSVRGLRALRAEAAADERCARVQAGRSPCVLSGSASTGLPVAA